ncbi:14-3-3 protein-domain-containing protein [Favolaschia claudopus]|uniref:14-3-3 protein-domain-containing protein n=1 Tax=Favolaschia claudopus TaxID=2862362 RepID=A0AAW0AL56_9AGAR
MSREQSMHLARLADKANRFGGMFKWTFVSWLTRLPSLDMLEYMKAVVTSGIDLTSEERNLFCAAYKMTVDSHRRSWKVITSVEKSGEVTGHPIHLALARKCKAKIEKDLTQTCEEVLHTLETQLISGAISHEAQVFSQKMAGDYYAPQATSGFWTEGVGFLEAVKHCSQSLQVGHLNVDYKFTKLLMFAKHPIVPYSVLIAS